MKKASPPARRAFGEWLAAAPAAVGRRLLRRSERIATVYDLTALPSGSEVIDRITVSYTTSLDRLRGFDLEHRGAQHLRRHEAFFARGFHLMVAEDDGQVIGYAWCTAAADGVGHPHLEWLGLSLGPKDVYLWELYVAPPFRGGGRALAFTRGVLAMLSRDGYERAFGYIDARNLPARVLHRSAGAQDLHRTVLKITPLRIMWNERGVFWRNRPTSKPFGFDYRRLWRRGR